MEYFVFLFLFGLMAIVTWVTQAVVLNILTTVLGFEGAGIRKTIKVIALLFLVSLALKVFSIPFAAMSPNSTGIGVVILLLTIGVSIAVIQKQYGGGFPRSALVYFALVTAGLLIAIITRTYIAQPFRIPTDAMTPGLEVNDRFLASKYAYKSSDPVRGDIVVFEFPGDRNLEYTKRIMGLPGETIEMREGIVYIDGSPIEDPWGVHNRLGIEENLKPLVVGFEPIVIPTGEYFMMGDNRDNSLDSRYFGPVSSDLLVGKAMLRYLPPTKMGRISH